MKYENMADNGKYRRKERGNCKSDFFYMTDSKATTF